MEAVGAWLEPCPLGLGDGEGPTWRAGPALQMRLGHQAPGGSQVPTKRRSLAALPWTDLG